MKHPVYLLLFFNSTSITERNVLYKHLHSSCLNFWEDCGKVAGQQCKYTCEVILLDWKLNNPKYPHCKLIICSSVNIQQKCPQTNGEVTDVR
jgi:hypothetical protein